MLALLPILGCSSVKERDNPQTQSRVVVFGDSLSDVGYYNNAPSIWQAFLAEGPWPIMGGGQPKESTFSTPVKNAIWTQQLGVQGLTYINKINNKNTVPDNLSTGAVVEIKPLPSNSIYAAGGSTTLCDCVPSPANDMGQNIYMAPPIGPLQPRKGGSVDSCSSDINKYNQIDAYLSVMGNRKGLLENNIHVLWGGANNAFLLLAQVGAETITPEQAVEGMVKVAQDLINDVDYLREKGAEKIVVINLPDLSITPAMTSNGADPESSTVQLAKAMSEAFNNTLEAEYSQDYETKLVKADKFFNTIVENKSIAINGEKFDFDNVIQSACPFTGVNSFACIPNANTNNYLFADTVHPTAHTHQALAN